MIININKEVIKPNSIKEFKDIVENNNFEKTHEQFMENEIRNKRRITKETD